jgi:hypothetical protein
MFHLSPRVWLDDQLLEIVEPEAFDLALEPTAPRLFLVPLDVDDDELSGVRNAGPSPARMRRRHVGIEFRVRLPSTPDVAFGTFDEATSYAVDQAAKNARSASIDVIAKTRAAARWWLGATAEAVFDKHPDGAALDTYVITASNLGPTP